MSHARCCRCCHHASLSREVSAVAKSNKQPTAHTPIPIVKYIKELTTAHPRVKGSGSLVASSSTIALAIASSSCDPTDAAPDEPGTSKESGWKTAYGAARIAVEAAKESSDMFLPLKAVLGALSVLIKNLDQAIANAEQIGDIEERVQSLSEVLKSQVGEQDKEEKARREALRRKLAKIIAKLRPFSEEHGLTKFLTNVDRANTLQGFVQDLAYAITDYQTSIQQGIYKNTQDIIEATDLDLLERLNPVHNAGYQAGHHDTCLPGTRESVLDEIMRWAKDPQDKHVFWLNGLAGTGKSTIAQTFSETIAKAGILGASFFCSRDYLDRQELKNIFPTLAHQLACRYPAFRRHIIRKIKQDPAVASNSLVSQLEDLIVGPLSSSNILCVIVVDALDECIDNQPASAILSVLGRHVKQLLSAKFFITGRPEPRIRSGFRLPLLEPLTQIFLLHEVKLTTVDGDIRLYLHEKLTEVSKRRSNLDLPDPWPCSEDLTTLTEKSSGLFIFASTLVRFIESEHHEPNARLRLIITPSDSTVHEGRTGIDPLYTQILAHAFSGVEDDVVFADLRRVLGAVVLGFNPLSRAQIAGILGVDASLVTGSLRHLHSVLLVPNEDSKKVRFFHKSFPDFLQDSGRCSDRKFFIDSSVHHGGIALDCLELLKKLERNPCNLPGLVVNRDVANLPELLEDKVGGAMRYACRYWAAHIRSSPVAYDYALQLISSATNFFKENAVRWIEVMSLENQLESVVHSIYALLDWRGMAYAPTSELRRLAQDCLRYTMHFFRPIQQSVSHIYHSALPLAPRSSAFHSDGATWITGFYGRPDTWGVVVRTITASSSKRSTCVTVFGYQTAIAWDDGTVAIFDSLTGVLRLSLSPADPVHLMRGSQDGSILFCTHKRPSVTSWDIQTGGLIHTFIPERNVKDIAISSKGHYLACRLSNGTVEIWDVQARMECAPIECGSLDTHLYWVEPEHQLAVAIGTSVRIWDVLSVRFLRSFTLQGSIYGMIYPPRLNRLIVVTVSKAGDAVNIIDSLQGLSPISHQIQQQISCFTFSQTTNQVVCGTETDGLELLDISTQCWRNLQYPDRATFISSLPNGNVVAKFASSDVQVLSLDDGDPSPQQPAISVLTVRSIDKDRIIAILPTSRDRIVLLELSTMLQLLTIPVHETHAIPVNRTHILCASLEKRTAVYCYEGLGREYLQLWVWRFGDGDPRWTVEIDGLPSIGGISPNGTLIVAFCDVDSRTFVCMWNTSRGQLEARLQVDLTQPFDFTFDVETEFYSHHDTYCVPFAVRSPALRGYRLSPDTVQITRREQQPPTRRTLGYKVDDTCEWVVRGSERICWIPPGYIGSVRPSHWWTGNLLVMAGQDGTIRCFALRT